MSDYSDIINLPHHEPDPRKHPRMSLQNRAAQFAPFAALTGYEERVAETARLTSGRAELSEEVKSEIDSGLREIRAGLECGSSTTVEVIYFVKDLRKSGGEYVTYSGIPQKIDTDRGIITVDEQRIPIDDIMSIRIIGE